MKSIIFALVLAAVPVSAADTSGIWKIDGTVAEHSINPTCTLRQTDNTLSGSCRLDDDHTAEITGFVKKKEVTWQYETDYDGITYSLTYIGTLDSDTMMKGSIAVVPSDAEGEFTAKRQ